MAHPLESSYNWRAPVGVATIGLIVCVGVLYNGRVAGWLTVALLLVVLWLLFLGIVWLRTRAYMMVDGPILRVRRFRHFQELDGRRVARVAEIRTPNGPSYHVWLHGDQTRYLVPAALLKRGHSTLFDWVLTWSPRAELDRGSLRTIDELRTRGLLE
ncbi:hypothetical protein GCM10009841_04420 [Microlunatus panaciterrae]|uniref:PH domain-containing protein n=1 Tax=Microlunatus panaciterrae TaxID=400768 RepID=A0ABS2RIS0_9ACTN|nr:hypothetical protein [Microlunatus panaciterrae]MBM7798900.1 hypothetical protein [Microlunatus panaciterrae]